MNFRKSRRTILFSLAVLASAVLSYSGFECAGAQGLAAGGEPAVVLHAASLGPAISSTLLGANSTASFDANISGQAEAFEAAGLRAGRWPGGSDADEYDWRTNKGCAGRSYIWYSAAFDNFMNRIAIPAGLDLEVTVNYGSADQPACDAPGDPVAAAAWVRHANKQHTYHIGWWEVGNEAYGSWETDKHLAPHDAATYASVFAQYARMMKAEDPTIKVGVPVSPHTADPSGLDWDTYVLGHTPFDYVDYHFYAQAPGKEDDSFLLQSAPLRFAQLLQTIKAELTAAGRPQAPIDVGEIGSVYDNPGKQAASITQALYAAEIIGEMMNAGVARAEWWVGNGGCGMKGNMSPSLYGWQDFGGYAIFSDGIPTPSYWGCKNASETIPFGTMLPTARMYQLLSESGFVTNGQHTVALSVPVDLSKIRAYASTTASGYGLLLVNLSPTETVRFPVVVDALPGGSNYATFTYGKVQYDQSLSGKWVGVAKAENGPWRGAIDATLDPYSMTVIMIGR